MYIGLVMLWGEKNQDVLSTNWLPCDTWIISLKDHREHPTVNAKWFQLWALSATSNEGEGSCAHLPSSAHLESTLVPVGVGDSQETGCGLSVYVGAELQLPNPHRHHKHFPGTVISTCVAPTKPQTFLGLPSGHAVILCVPFNQGQLPWATLNGVWATHPRNCLTAPRIASYLWHRACEIWVDKCLPACLTIRGLPW